MSKIVQHPSAASTPQMMLANAVGLADTMAGAICMYTDKGGNMHIAWTGADDRDLASFAVVLADIAARRLRAL